MTICYQNNAYLCKSADRYGVMSYRHEEAYSSSAFLYRRHNIKVGNMEQKEEWKPIIGYEGLYEVSNYGRVRSLTRTIVRSDGRIQTFKGVILSGTMHNRGYRDVVLTKDGISTRYLIHRLVATAFIPNPYNKPELDHINTIRTDNRVENLRWVTRRENCANNITRKRIYDRANSSVVKEKILSTKVKNNSRLAPKRVYQFTIDGEFIAEYSSCHEATRETGISFTSISTVARRGKHPRNEKSAGGYLWSYDKNNPPVYPFDSIKYRFRKVYQYDSNWNLIKEWDSAAKAAKELGATASTIIRYARGIRTTKYKGFHWSFELLTT